MKTIFVKGFDKEEFNKWLSDNDKMNNKITLLEFLATVKNDEEACKLYEDVLLGNIKTEEMATIDVSEQMMGLAKIIDGIGSLVGKHDEELVDSMLSIPPNVASKVANKLIDECEKEIGKIYMTIMLEVMKGI